MGANQDSVFSRLCDAMERSELATDPRFRDHVARGENQAELDELISAWSATLDADPLLDRLEEFGVPAGRIYRAPDMLATRISKRDVRSSTCRIRTFQS